MNIGILFPRSKAYPLIGSDFLEGIKSFTAKAGLGENTFILQAVQEHLGLSRRAKKPSHLPQDEARLLEQILEVIRVRLTACSIARPQQAQYVVERLAAVTPAADVEIERDHREAALQVVADGGVEVRFVGLVQLDPRIERALLEALVRATRRGHEARPVIEHLLEEALGGDPPRAAQRESIVVAGQAFHHPQAWRVRLARVIEVE